LVILATAALVPESGDMRKDEFRLVTLPEPARRCATCVSFAYLWDRPEQPHADWHGAGATRLPLRWRVVGPVLGDAIPLGTTLDLIDVMHQVFPADHQGLRTESINWLLAARDGQRLGETFFAMTWDEHDEDPDDGIPWGLAGDPRWPAGLEPVLTA
jgi:hypothetical protein